MLKYIVSRNDTIVIYLGGKMYIIDTSHANHSAIFAEIRKDQPDKSVVLKMLSIAKQIEEYTNGHVTIKNGTVYYDGEAFNSVLTERIMGMLQAGYSPEPFVNFLNNLMDNPSKRSVDELFNFLKHTGLPITQDGHVIGYKKVRDDYMDWYTGKHDNHPGQTRQMRRNQVNDDADQTCSHGYHIGTLYYARDAFHKDDGRIVLVSFNPADVVSVPTDYSGQKLRTCRYKVLADFEGVDALDGMVYSPKGEKITPADFQRSQEEDADTWVQRDEEANMSDSYEGDYEDDDDWDDEEDDDDWDEDDYED